MSEIIIECGDPNPIVWTEPEYDVVWLTEERTYAYLIQQGAYFSKVKYQRDGEMIEENVENDEYEPWGNRAIDYEIE